MGILLDPLAPEETIFTDVPLVYQTVHQQVAQDPTTGDWYFTQVVEGDIQFPDEPAPVSAAQRREHGDLAITHLGPTGNFIDFMVCRGFDHGAGIAVERDGGVLYVWTAYDAAVVPEGQNAHGSKIARYPYQPMTLIDVGDPSVEAFDPFPGARAVLPSIDFTPDVNQRPDMIALNYALPGQDRRYAVWRLSDFRAHNFAAPLYDIPWNVQENWQSFVLNDGYIYQFHGVGYSAANQPPGNAFFAIIDITTGRTTRIAAMDKHPALEHREPESITVLRDPGGDRLAYGFATGPVGARRVNLYATEAGSGPGTWISAEVLEGQGIALDASLEDRDGLRTWSIVRRPDGAVLFEGTAGEFPAGVAEFMDTAPPRCVELVYELHLDYENRQEQTESRPVIWIPAGGCGGGGPATPVADAVETLGCAESYTVRVHWRGGGLEKPLDIMDRVSEVTWSRTLNDVSTAEVTLVKGGPECCREIQDVHPWVHELSVYRNVRGTAELVWQGPIEKVRVGRDTIVIEANDVFAWLDRLVNTYRVTYNTTEPINGNRRRGTIVYIAWNHLRLNLEHSSLSVPPDYPGIMDYVVAREDGLPVISVEKDGSSDKSIWAAYLGDIFREWTKRGLTWTTVGRALLLRGFPNQQTLPIARFGLDDLLGDVEVIRDGTQTTTYGFATSQRDQNITEGFTVGWGHIGTAYGRLDRLIEVNDETLQLEVTDDDPEPQPTPAQQAEMLQIAKDLVAGRFPTPLVLQLPQDAQLSPEAPVTLDRLVPGERFDVHGADFCLDVAQGFALSDLEGSWENGREKISVGLVPLDELRDGEEGQPDD